MKVSVFIGDKNVSLLGVFMGKRDCFDLSSVKYPHPDFVPYEIPLDLGEVLTAGGVEELLILCRAPTVPISIHKLDELLLEMGDPEEFAIEKVA